MTNSRVEIDCLLLGEYVDEAEAPPGVAVGEVERPRMVAEYLDCWARDQGEKEFTVLLQDNRVVTVRGRSLKMLETAHSDQASYAVLQEVGGAEVIVGLFRADQVVGIFNGVVKSAGETA